MKNPNKTFMETLKDYLKDNTIDTADGVLEVVENMKEREKYLAQHEYAITENKDGRFSTYIKDESKPNHRRKLVKSTREELEKELIKHYKGCDEEQLKKNMCMEDLYPEWLDYKAVHTDSSEYIRSIDLLWKKFYKGTAFVRIPISKLDTITLDTWLHNTIRENDMTKKCYSNMAIIVKQMLEYAEIKGIISKTPYTAVKIETKLFRKTVKKPDETQVFMTDELSVLVDGILKEFEEKRDIPLLGILFGFLTGMRVSELVACQFTDLCGSYIHVQRMETQKRVRNEDGTWSRPERIVTERTKTIAGDREVYLSAEALKILDDVRQVRAERGIDSDYIFADEKGRINAHALSNRLRRMCEKVGIPARGMHALRRVYISTLIDAGFNINTIRAQVGHADERTTYKSYCYDRKPKEIKQEEFEKTLRIFPQPA